MDIESLYASGKMPEWIYAQQNGKSATINLNRHLSQLRKKYGSEKQKNIEKIKRQFNERLM